MEETEPKRDREWERESKRERERERELTHSPDGSFEDALKVPCLLQAFHPKVGRERESGGIDRRERGRERGREGEREKESMRPEKASRRVTKIERGCEQRERESLCVCVCGERERERDGERWRGKSEGRGARERDSGERILTPPFPRTRKACPIAPPLRRATASLASERTCSPLGSRWSEGPSLCLCHLGPCV